MLHEAPDPDTAEVIIWYHSEYAAQMAQDNWNPVENMDLVDRVKDLRQRVLRRRV